MLKSRPIVGSTTLTIVMSMMFMNMADTKTVPTTIFWFMREYSHGRLLPVRCVPRPTTFLGP